MSHFARVDENDIVVDVIVAEQDFIDSGAVGDPAQWIQTSYNTHFGVHTQGGTPLRANYATIGCTYDRTNDVFYPAFPIDLPTAVISGAPEWKWTFPIPRPAEGYKYTWSEELGNWVLKPEEEWNV
jgi:hypothetical protein